MSRGARAVFAVVATAGWFALILQLVLIVARAPGLGQSLGMALAAYVGFFTIQTNLLVAASMTAMALAPTSRLATWFARPTMRTALAVYITIVGSVYWGVLARLWKPTGWQFVADLLLHTLVPIAVVLLWLVSVPHRQLGARAPLWWLVYPLVYFGLVMVGGAILRQYPYPFVDVQALGIAIVLRNAAVLTLGFVVVSYAFLGLDRLLPSRQPPPSRP